MKRRIHNCISSQKSPRFHCITLKKRVPGAYPYMFLDDFCALFSGDLSLSGKDDGFYGVNPKEDRLWELLRFEDYSFFDYNMDKLLCSLVDSMVHHGTAYLEIVTWENQDKELVGLSFVPIKPIVSIKAAETTLFASVQYDKKIKFYKIHNSRIIRFRLKDVGFSRYYLYRLLKKLKKYDVTNVGDMSLSPQNSGFDFTEYVRKREFGLLKVTRQVGWYGRNGDNQHMGEGYLLYRIARAKTVRLKMLNYLLQQINGALKPLEKELGFSGSIIINSIDTDFSKIFDKLEKGEINYSQVGDIVIRRLGYEK